MGVANIHPLRIWRTEQQPKLTLDAAAAAIGTTRQTWYDYESGRRVPERRFMIEIYRLTKGEIRPDHFYDLPDLATAELPLAESAAPAPLFDRPQPAALDRDLQAAA